MTTDKPTARREGDSTAYSPCRLILRLRRSLQLLYAMETIYPTGTEPSVGVSALVALEATLPLKTASTFAEKKGNEGD